MKQEKQFGSQFNVESTKLTNEQQVHLVEQIIAADALGDEYTKNKAFEELWASISKLAMSILQKTYGYIMFNPRYHTAIEEMMVEAAAWVYKDLKAFDPSMTFNTFAGYRIKRAGHMYVAEVINNRTEKYEQFSIKINKTISELKQKGVDFDLQTISTVSGIPLVTIEEVLAQNSANATSISLNDPSITAGKANQEGVTALDEYLSANDLASYYKKDTPSPEEISVEKEEAKKIRAALSKLDKTTREIVKLKNGFYNSAIGDGEIAERLGISQNEVRQRYSSGRRELRRILEKDVTFSDRAIVGRAKKLDKTIKFMPSVSDTDIEDAAHFMTLDIVV